MKKLITVGIMACSLLFWGSAIEAKTTSKKKSSKKTTVVSKKKSSKTSTSTSENEYIETASGLKYRVIQEGTGRSPKATDVVVVHYEGILPDGTVFDSSYAREVPTAFPLNLVIQGWTEGLQLMKEGAKYEFYIPSKLAYGEKGGGPIAPNQDLIFVVELLEVQ